MRFDVREYVAPDSERLARASRAKYELPEAALDPLYFISDSHSLSH
jgi:hypothetical protein